MKRAGTINGVVVPVLLSVVPGWGHIWVRRYTRGLLLFIFFFAILDFAVVSLLIHNEDRVPVHAHIAGGLCAAVLAFTIMDILRITVWLRTKTVSDQRDLLLRKTVNHYLRNQHGQAEDSIQRMLRIDPYDTMALFYLGMVHRASGRKRKAILALKKALKIDAGRHWSPDLERELARTKETPDSPS